MTDSHRRFPGDATLRDAPRAPADLEFLAEMLLEAFCWQTGTDPASRARFEENPEFLKWISD